MTDTVIRCFQYNILDFMDYVFYIDAVQGDDTNNLGIRSSLPFKTIKRAIDYVPSGSKILIYLRVNQDHFIEEDIILKNKTIYFRLWLTSDDNIGCISYNENNRSPNFPTIKNVSKLDLTNDDPGNISTGFILLNKSQLFFDNVNITTPFLYDSSLNKSKYQGFIKYEELSEGSIQFKNSIITINDIDLLNIPNIGSGLIQYAMMNSKVLINGQGNFINNIDNLPLIFFSKLSQAVASDGTVIDFSTLMNLNRTINNRPVNLLSNLIL